MEKTLIRIETETETCEGCAFNKSHSYCGAYAGHFPCRDLNKRKEYIWVVNEDEK